MPDWVFNSITFYTDTKKGKEQLTIFHKALHDIIEGPTLLPNGFGSKWLGNVAHWHGLYPDEVKCCGDIHYFGELNLDSDDGFFEVCTETAWSPTEELWERVLEHYPDVSHVFVAEECCNDIWINTDAKNRFYANRYFIEFFDDFNDDGEDAFIKPFPEGYVSEKHRGATPLNILHSMEGERLHFKDFGSLQQYFLDLTGKRFDSASEMEGYLESTIEAYKQHYGIDDDNNIHFAFREYTQC